MTRRTPVAPLPVFCLAPRFGLDGTPERWGHVNCELSSVYGMLLDGRERRVLFLPDSPGGRGD